MLFLMHILLGSLSSSLALYLVPWPLSTTLRWAREIGHTKLFAYSYHMRDLGVACRILCLVSYLRDDKLATRYTVYGIRGPSYESPSVSGMHRIMAEGGDLHALLPPMDAFPILRSLLPFLIQSYLVVDSICHFTMITSRYLPDFIWPWRKTMTKMSSMRALLFKSTISSPILTFTFSSDYITSDLSFSP